MHSESQWLNAAPVGHSDGEGREMWRAGLEVGSHMCPSRRVAFSLCAAGRTQSGWHSAEAGRTERRMEPGRLASRWDHHLGRGEEAQMV